MQKGARLFRIVGALVALGAVSPIASLATDGGALAETAKQAGEDRWVPSLAITSGLTIQDQKGSVASFIIAEGGSPTISDHLRPPTNGDDLAVSPFVGGALELMAPAFSIPMRPRLFVSGERRQRSTPSSSARAWAWPFR